MTQSNLETLRSAFDQWNETRGGSVETWLSLCSDNVAFLSSAMGRKGLEFTEPCACKDDMRRYFTGLLSDWAMDHYTMDRFVADGDVVMCHGSTKWTNRQTGKSFDVLTSCTVDFQDGRIVRFIEHYDSAPIVEAMSA